MLLLNRRTPQPKANTDIQEKLGYKWHLRHFNTVTQEKISFKNGICATFSLSKVFFFLGVGIDFMRETDCKKLTPTKFPPTPYCEYISTVYNLVLRQ